VYLTGNMNRSDSQTHTTYRTQLFLDDETIGRGINQTLDPAHFLDMYLKNLPLDWNISMDLPELCRVYVTKTVDDYERGYQVTWEPPMGGSAGYKHEGIRYGLGGKTIDEDFTSRHYYPICDTDDEVDECTDFEPFPGYYDDTCDDWHYDFDTEDGADLDFDIFESEPGWVDLFEDGDLEGVPSRFCGVSDYNPRHRRHMIRVRPQSRFVVDLVPFPKPVYKTQQVAFKMDGASVLRWTIRNHGIESQFEPSAPPRHLLDDMIEDVMQIQSCKDLRDFNDSDYVKVLESDEFILYKHRIFQTYHRFSKRMIIQNKIEDNLTRKERKFKKMDRENQHLLDKQKEKRDEKNLSKRRRNQRDKRMVVEALTDHIPGVSRIGRTWDRVDRATTAIERGADNVADFAEVATRFVYSFFGNDVRIDAQFIQRRVIDFLDMLIRGFDLTSLCLAVMRLLVDLGVVTAAITKLIGYMKTYWSGVLGQSMAENQRMTVQSLTDSFEKMDFSALNGIAGTTAGVISAVIIGQIPDWLGETNKVKCMADKAQGLWKIASGVSAVEKFANWFQKLFTWITCMVLGKTENELKSAALVVGMADEMKIWATRILELDDPVYRNLIPNDPEMQTEIFMLRDQMVNFCHDLIGMKNCPSTLTTNFRMLQTKCEELFELAKTPTFYANARIDPFAICFYGKPGVGKSGFVHHIVNVIAESQKRPKANRVFARTPQVKHWDGYTQQFAVIQDDFAQVVAGDDVAEFMQMKTNTEFQPPMAKLTEKGRKFDSMLVVQTANDLYPQPNQIRHSGALWRRRNELIEVDWQPGMPKVRRPDFKNLRFRIRDPEDQCAEALDVWATSDEMCKYLVNKYKIYMATQLELLDAVAPGEKRPKIILDDDGEEYEDLGLQAGDRMSIQANKKVTPPGFWQSTWTCIKAASMMAVTMGTIIVPIEMYNRWMHGQDLVNTEYWKCKIRKITRTVKTFYGGFAEWVRDKRHDRMKALLGTVIIDYKPESVTQSMTFFDFLSNLNHHQWDFPYDEPLFGDIKEEHLAYWREAFEEIGGDLAEIRNEDGLWKDVVQEMEVHPDHLDGMMRIYADWRALHASYEQWVMMRTPLVILGVRKVEADASEKIRVYIEQHPTLFKVLAAVLGIAAVYGAYRVGNSLYNSFFKDEKVKVETLVPSGDSATKKAKTTKLATENLVPSGDSATRKARTTKLATETKMEVEAFIDPNTGALLPVLARNNLVRVEIQVKLEGDKVLTIKQNGVIVRNRQLLLNAHALYTTLKGYDSTITVWKNGLDYTFEFEKKRVTWISKKSVEDDGKTKIAFVDRMIYEMPATIPSSRDITGLFVSEKDLNNVGKCPGILMSRNNEDHMVMCTMISKLEPITEVRAYDEVDNVFLVCKGYKYRGVSTAKGDCGGLIMAENTHVPGKILGIHQAGCKSLGQCILITSEMLQEMTKNEILPVTPAIVEDRMEIQDLEQLELCPDGRFLVIGKAPKGKEIFQPRTTQIEPSELHGEIYPVTTEPAALSKNHPACKENNWDPLQDGIGKNGVGGKDFSVKTMEAVLKYTIIENAHIDPTYPRDVLTEEQVLNGIEGEEYIERLNLDSSPGYPYTKIRVAGMKGKSAFINNERTGKYEVVEKTLRGRLDKRESEGLKGRRIVSSWVDCLKDERRPKAKVWKTRIFNIGPVDHTILVKRYFGRFIAWYMKNRYSLSGAVGMNVDSPEWNQMWEKLREVGNFGFDGDYEKYDAKMRARLIVEYFVKLVNAWYGDSAENQLFRSVLMDEIAHTIHRAGDCIYMSFQGNKSGCALTTILNCIINDFYIKAGWIEIMKYFADCEEDRVRKATLAGLIPLRKYAEYIRAKVYGDDNVVVVNHQVTDYFNAKTFSAWLADHDIVYTPATKGERTSALDRIEDLQFLKRHQRKHGTGLILAPIEKQTIHELTNWIRKSIDDEAAMYQNLEDSARFAYQWGEEYFEEHVGRINKALRDKELRPLNVSYDDYDYEYFSQI
jgi:hypothetical protein